MDESNGTNIPPPGVAPPQLVVTDSQTLAAPPLVPFIPSPANVPLALPLLAPVHPIIPTIAIPPPPPPQIIPAVAPTPLAAAAAVVSHAQLLPRPLAPLPIRPPVFKPPSPPPSNGGGGGDVNMKSDSDSDEEEDDDEGAAVGYELSEASKQAKERQEKIRQDFMLKRRAAALAVPTNDKAVRDRLRRLGEPITFFGEREMERRDRLRMLMVKLDAQGQLDKLMKAQEDEEIAAGAAAGEDGEDDILQYPFYTEGSRELLATRIDIANYSIKRASLRVLRAKRRRDDPDEDVDSEIDWALRQAGGMTLDCSEIGDDRPLSGCSYSWDGNLLATCSLSGVAKLWSMPQVKKVCTLKGHSERATDVVFSPVHNHLATASADRTAKLWDTEGNLLMTFQGHLDRLARIAFHPSGKYLATTSFDKTWRLWDVQSGVELLLQEGHSRSVYGIAFHNDGSLVASSGLDAVARVWDLRTGRSILAFEGHVKPVLGLSFSPNGYHLATGGEDNACRIWDIRMRKSAYTIPAHSNLISQVKYEPQEGYFLVTSSYDMTAKVWSARDYKPVKTLSGHEAKVTSLDIKGDGHCIATVAHDRTIKVWSASEKDLDKKMVLD